MPLTALTETDSYTAQCLGPQDGDKITAATVNSGLQALACRTLHHNTHGVFDKTKDGGTAYENATDVKMANGTTYYFGHVVHKAAHDETYFASCTITHTSTTLTGKIVQLAGYRECLKTKWHTDADSTITPADARIHYLPAITANRLRTIPVSGITDGEWVIIKRMRPDGVVGGYTETIQSGTSQVLFIFAVGNLGDVRLDYSSTAGEWIPGPYNSVNNASLTGTGLYGN